MRSLVVHPGVLPAVERALCDGPWLDDAWDERVRRFGEALLGAFRASVGRLSPAVCAAAAYTAARNEMPLVPPEWHEVWGRVLLAWVAREVSREATRARARGGAEAGELMDLALETLRAADALGGPVLPHAHHYGAPRAVPVERLVERARDALSDPGFAETVEPEHVGFFTACFQQLRHTTSLLILGEPCVEKIVRAAVLRADRFARRGSPRGWADAPAPLRRHLAARGLIETGAALALAVPREHAERPAGDGTREACLWFARTATRIARCAADADTWFGNEAPLGGERARGAARATDGGSDSVAVAPARGVEAAVVKETQQTILRTLETDARDAAWRTAGSQFVKLTREPLVGLLSRHLAPGDEALRARLAAFLETEIGTALLASLLSLGLSAMPAGAGEVPQRLGRELRVRAMADAGDVLADLLMAPLRQVAATYLQDPGFAVRPAGPSSTAVLDDPAEVLRADNVVPMAAQG